MALRSRRRVFSVLAVLAIAALVVAAREPLLRAAGHALVTHGPVEQSDVIVVPDWTGESGALEAADAIRQGAASRAAVLLDVPSPAALELVRRGVSRKDESRVVDLLRALGVSEVNEVRHTGSGTSAEMTMLPLWCERNQVRSVIVVSTPDHSSAFNGYVVRWRLEEFGPQSARRDTRPSIPIAGGTRGAECESRSRSFRS